MRSAKQRNYLKHGHNLKWDYFEILASGRSDTDCKKKETVLIKDPKPFLNEILISLSSVKNFTFLSLHGLFICKFPYHTPSNDSLISYLFYI